MRLVWSQLADRQVDEALAYILAEDAAAARRWLEELLGAVGRLPQRWAQVLSAGGMAAGRVPNKWFEQMPSSVAVSFIRSRRRPTTMR